MHAEESLEYEHDHSNDKFFGLIGILTIVFGASIALYNMMHSPVLSGIAAVLFLLLGGVCSMIAAGGYFRYLDEKFFND